MSIYWTQLSKIARVFFATVNIINLVSFYNDYVFNGIFTSFACIGLILIGLSFLFIFISIFNFHLAIYWAGFFQYALALFIIYDFPNIRLTKPDTLALNKGFYSLSAAVQITFMVIMFKNHTIFHIIFNSVILAVGVSGLSFRALEEELSVYLIFEKFVYFIVLSIY